jgi:uncharacterized protein YegJ (DUF2314 family)
MSFFSKLFGKLVGTPGTPASVAREDEPLVPVPIPALSVLLLHLEKQKGAPLSEQEVSETRDKAACIMLPLSAKRAMDEKRGYQDINPENVWLEWQAFRAEALPEGNLPQGDLVVEVPAADASLQMATQEAQRSLDHFTAAVQHPGSRQSNFQVKLAVEDGHYVWLNQVEFDGALSGVLGLDAAGLHPAGPGARVTVPARDVEDWMYAEDGKLVGGFSLRAIRARLTGEPRRTFEEGVGLRFE